MSTKNSENSRKRYGAAYKSNKVFDKNRKRKLEALLKLQPNNEQIKQALKDIHYRRKTPTTAQWSHSDIRIAKLFKEVMGFFDKKMLHPDPRVQQAAVLAPSKHTYQAIPFPKDGFSIGARAWSI